LISCEEAVLLLKGLREKVTPVRVNMVTGSARCAFVGLVSEVSESEIVLTVPFKVSCAMLVRLEGARFEWGDTREAPEEMRGALAEKFSSALSILLPDRTKVVVSELNVAR
jgi:hypothetical protein